MPLRTLSDERLAELASAGHSDAFGTLYERYRDALSRYCRSIVRDTEDAGDALQNTMVSVLRALQGRGPSGPVRPWLYRIAHNESISILRRRRPHEELSAETPDRADTEYASLAKARLDALLADLHALPERQRGAIVMRELGGLEYSEIGDVLDMTAVAARKHVFEARVSLHDIEAGRQADCGDIVRRISDGDGRVLRARSVRGHLRGCPSCSAFERGLRARRSTLALIPPLPLVSTGAILAAALHGGGGAATSGLAGGSMAGGSVAGGSIAAGSIAAAGSLLGGGSFAAFKGIALAGALAVAGAGVVVGTSITSHVHHSPPSTPVVAHRVRVPRARSVALAAPAAAKPVRLAAARPSVAPAPSAARVAGLSAAPSSTHQASAVLAPPRPSRPTSSAPSTQAPAAAVPVAVRTPTTTSTATPPPSSTSTTPTATATPTPTPGAPVTASWINAIVQNALQVDGADLAAAEAQAQQQLAAAGVSPTTAALTIQGLITSILSGAHK